MPLILPYMPSICSKPLDVARRADDYRRGHRNSVRDIRLLYSRAVAHADIFSQEEIRLIACEIMAAHALAYGVAFDIQAARENRFTP